jgi:uncharacterized caspase-like protein
MRGRTIIAAIIAVLSAWTLQAETARRRAILIGINDYSASTLAHSMPSPDRAWSNLDGAVNDVDLMRELVIALYDFKSADVVTLKDQQATRDGVFRALQRLLAQTQKNDVVLFYYSGHGSQVRNSRSAESDRLDESLVPADSRRGAPDIRDKELLPFFNGILDRGARLTIVLDTCHSGSGARGLDSGLRARAVKSDLRDVADPSEGQRPERRGALILSAAQDFDLAFETLDEHGKIRGAFTWALARALRDAHAGEPATETFLRARARLQAERPSQDPVLAGRDDIRQLPFLGIRGDRRAHGSVIAVEKTTGPGTYLLQGGWASGLTVGSELRLVDGGPTVEVTALLGVSHAVARMRTRTTPLQPGALLELVTWAAPPSPPLRVWIPRAECNALATARALREEAVRRRDVHWLEDPTETSPTHLLRWSDGAWELVTNGVRRKVATPPMNAVPAGAMLFVQLPAPAQLVDEIGSVDGVEITDDSRAADYVLTGRLAHDGVEYAWVRPSVTAADRTRSILPLRSAWIDGERAFALRDSIVQLRRVQGWQELRSPAASAPPYRLAVRRAVDGALVDDGRLLGSTRYELVLRERRRTSDEPVFARYVYAFVIDSDGSSVLLFPSPETGSVENLLPVTLTPAQPLRHAPAEIPLVGARPFVIGEPYGLDTYFLLSTGEPLPSLASLEWRGVRAASAGSARKSPIEELLAQTLAGTRGPDEPIRTPPDWSIDKVIFESVSPRRVAR